MVFIIISSYCNSIIDFDIKYPLFDVFYSTFDVKKGTLPHTIVPLIKILAKDITFVNKEFILLKKNCTMMK